jgi:hypothetical protein
MSTSVLGTYSFTTTPDVAGVPLMLNGGSTPSIQSGLFSARPAAGNAGYLYIATDTQQLFRDSGSAWVLIADGTLTSGATTLTGLTDTTITSPAVGQLLNYNGSQWTNWTPTYISANQTLTLSGDITGSGTTAITGTLANTGVTAGTYTKVTVNAKGLATAGNSLNSSDVITALGYTPSVGSGAVLQVLTSAVAAISNTATITLTNTTPTTSNGTQVWSQVITPTAATSRISLRGSFVVSASSSNRQLIIMTFRGSTCIGTSTAYVSTSSSMVPATISIVDAPSSTSATTYSVRVAITSAATWHVGQTGTAYFGGTLAMNDISVSELA